MKSILLIPVFFVAFSVTASEKLCKSYNPTNWEKLKEKAFTKEAVEKEMLMMEKVAKGEIKVAEEFIWQTEVIIKGALLRNSVLATKSENLKKSHEYYLKQYCEFLENEARIIH